MPSCGIGLGLPYSGTRTDSDALSFITRAGITDSVTIPQYDRVNLLPNSEQLASNVYSQTGTTITSDATTSPTSTNTADLLSADGTSVSHVQNFGLGSNSFFYGTTHTISGYFKAGTNNYVQLTGNSTIWGSNVWANFDLSLGVVGSKGASCTSTITSVGSGWYRCTMTATVAASNGGVAQFGITIISSATSARAEVNTLATGVYVWGLQVEVGSSATAYISTTTGVGYANTGTITVNPRQQIIDFVKQMKAQDLWTNMLCWPLRSIHNAGTGTTAYSLGGLGIRNGNLVNGPTWGTDAMQFSSNSAVIQAANVGPLLASYSNLLFLRVSGYNRSVMGTTNNSGDGFALEAARLVYAGGVSSNYGALTYANLYGCDWGYANPSTPELTYGSGATQLATNTSTAPAVAATFGNNPTFAINNRGTQTTYGNANSSVSFALVIKNKGNVGAAIYNIVKNTLGYGLTGL